jgi:hypothetical protein
MSDHGGDSFDIAAERAQIATDAAVARIRSNAAIRPGNPGHCDYCYVWSPRLISSLCARCRDELKVDL